MNNSKFNDKKEWRKFAFGLSIILAVITAIQWFINSNLSQYTAISGLIILLIGIIVPVIIKPLYILFSHLSFVLGWIMTRIILIILYYLIFTPFGLLLKLLGKELLDTTFSKGGESYWKDRKPIDISPANYKNQY